MSKKPKLATKWEREMKRRRVLIMVISAVIASSMALISYGVYNTHIKPWHQTVVKVNNRVFDMNYFVKMLRLNGAAQSQDLQTTIQTAVETIQNNEVVRQKAEEFGLTVTADEIDAELLKWIAIQLGITITGGDTEDEVLEKIAEKLSGQTGYNSDNKTLRQAFDQWLEFALKGIGISVAEYKKLEIEPVILQRKVQEAIGNVDYPRDVQYDYSHIKAVLVGTREKALAIKGKWNGDFSQIVTDYLPDQYFPRGGYWILEVIAVRGEGDAKELHVKGIMLPTEAKAQDMKAQLVAGGDFAALAQTNSVHSSGQYGGDMGWLGVSRAESRFGAGINAMELNVLSVPIPQFIEWLPAHLMSPTFDGFAFDATSEGSGVSQPIRDTTYTTKGGYWLIKLVEKRGDGETAKFELQGILLDSNERANAIKSQIMDDGADFAALATSDSLHTDSSAKGGDLGSLDSAGVQSMLGADNLAIIQALGKGEISFPFLDAQASKQSGYWLIEVLGKEQRNLTEDNWDVLSQQAFTLWFQQKIVEDGIKSYPDNNKLSWALEHV